VELAPWPESAPEKDIPTPVLPFNPSDTVLEKKDSEKDET
jgi:hypothetical protein